MNGDINRVKMRGENHVYSKILSNVEQ